MLCFFGKEKNYLIIIPAYNEGESLLEVVSALHRYRSFVDILIIDDGSEDQTQNIVDDLKGVISIRHKINKGYGATLIEGFNYAIENGYQYAITIDADKQHNPDDIEKFLSMNKKVNYDILSGSRYYWSSQEKHRDAPEDRRRVNLRITQKINQLTGYELTDAFCGFKLYKVESLRKLHLDEVGYAMPLQLWLEASKNDLKVVEIPVELIYYKENRGVALYKDPCKRYKYYLTVIEKTTEIYENTSACCTSR
ncbi:MAG: glycosyltransferase family 2 protein [Bacteroidales bacterium]